MELWAVQLTGDGAQNNLPSIGAVRPASRQAVHNRNFVVTKRLAGGLDTGTSQFYMANLG